MKLRFARSLVLIAGMTAFPTVSPAVLPPQQPPRVNALAGPQKAVHDAQANLDLARKQLLVIRKHVETSFETKPEWKAAKDALEKAKLNYDTEMRRVTLVLEKDPAYTALEAKRDKAQAVVDSAHTPVTSASGDDPVKLTDEEINTAVKDHQDAVLAIKEMQKRAGENNPTLAALLQKRTEAQTTWDALESQVDEQVKNDPNYPAAQTAVDQAEQALKSAKDQLAAASKMQRDADEAALKSRMKTPSSKGR